MSKKTTTKIPRQRLGSHGDAVKLKFLVDFMRANRINCQTIADRLGLTRQATNHMLRADDALLSQVERIAKEFGHILYISLSRPGDDSVRFDNISKSIPSGLEFRSTRRLKFLFDAMAYLSLNHKEVSAALNMHENAVKYWFDTDDIRIRHIYKFAKIYGFNLRIEIIPASLTVIISTILQDPMVRNLVKSILDGE